MAMRKNSASDSGRKDLSVPTTLACNSGAVEERAMRNDGVVAGTLKKSEHVVPHTLLSLEDWQLAAPAGVGERSG